MCFDAYAVRMNIDELLSIAWVLKCKKTKTAGIPQHAGCILCSDRCVYYRSSDLGIVAFFQCIHVQRSQGTLNLMSLSLNYDGGGGVHKLE